MLYGVELTDGEFSLSLNQVGARQRRWSCSPVTSPTLHRILTFTAFLLVFTSLEVSISTILLVGIKRKESNNYKSLLYIKLRKGEPTHRNLPVYQQEFSELDILEYLTPEQLEILLPQEVMASYVCSKY